MPRHTIMVFQNLISLFSDVPRFNPEKIRSVKGPKPINRSKIENVENRDREMKAIQTFRKENPDLEILPSGLRKNIKDRQKDENRPKRHNQNFLRSLSSRSWP